MFPFFFVPCSGEKSMSAKSYKERRLKFLQWIRDDLETRLAGINAAIATLESQLNQEETT
ncbi:MAG: hypothetical protein QNJ70_25100 [Xenococcaceae cyanobacterium MO_207.B15]|nr:hypothetical protein [Xenococcaceae cyanobacterium MO_207.B15]